VTLHPQAVAALELWDRGPKVTDPGFGAEGIAAMRADALQAAALEPKEPVHRALDLDADGVPCRLFVPTAADTHRVLVFVHGGGFIMGDKRSEQGPFYRNVGDYAARQGWIGVVPTYPLAPDHPWPAGPEALKRVVEWIGANVAEYGGDPERIVLSGQSAGAVHVASYLAHPAYHAVPGGGVRGAVLMSGLYDTTVGEANDNHRAYYGTDAARYAEANCLPGLLSTQTPLCFTVSEFDPPMFQAEAARTVGAWGEAKGGFPEMHYLVGHNHLTPSQSLGTPIKDVEALVADFVGRVTA